MYIVTLVDYIPAKRLFNLEGTRIGSLLFLAAQLSTEKYAVTILDTVFGCHTAGTHLIIALERTIDKLPIDLGHCTLHPTPGSDYYY